MLLTRRKAGWTNCQHICVMGDQGPGSLWGDYRGPGSSHSMESIEPLQDIIAAVVLFQGAWLLSRIPDQGTGIPSAKFWYRP